MSKSKLSPEQIVAYFDFDGTLTTRDTLLPFILYAVGFIKFLSKLHLVLMVLVLYAMKIFDNEQAKEFFLTIMLKGLDKEYLEGKAYNFALKRLDRYIKADVYAKLEYHLEHHHQVILVSANLAIYLRYWIKKHCLTDVIATELEVCNGVITGKLATRNCYGRHKVSRIRDYLKSQSQQFIYSYGYGNSHGDYALLCYVDVGYWVSGQQIIGWKDYRETRR
jgi:HAD superfamily hydrolase (TIGR01490 family)